MSELLPIVPDCLCVVTKGSAAGNEVTAVKLLPKYTDDTWWEVEAPWLQETNPLWRAKQSELMRIDGDPDQARHSEKERPVENVA